MLAVRCLLTHNNGLECDTLRKATHHITGQLWLPQIYQVKEVTGSSGLFPSGHQLTPTFPKEHPQQATPTPHAKLTCQRHFFLSNKTSPPWYLRQKGVRGVSGLDLVPGTKQNDPYNRTLGKKVYKNVAFEKPSIVSCLRLKLYTVMLWYCLVSSSVSHFAQLLSDKTGSRHSLFCMHSSSLKNIFIQLLR